MRPILGFLLISTVSLLAGCGGGDSGSSGGAPTISALSFSPTRAYVDSGGGQVAVRGTIDFYSPNGDLSTLTLNVLSAGGQPVSSQTVDVGGAGGVRSGTLQGSATVSTATIEDYTVRVFVTDGRGRRSNELEGTFRITAFPWVSKTPMPTPREYFATAVLDGLIYVIGGTDTQAPTIPQPSVDIVEVYDPADDSWSTAPSMPVAVSRQMAATARGKIYSIGGVAIRLGNARVQEFDPATQTWTLRTDMPYSTYYAAVAVHDDLIYIAGGELSRRSLVWYDPATDEWSEGASPSQGRQNSAGAAIDGEILVYGGAEDSGTQFLGSVEAYDPVTDTWSSRAPGEARRDFGVAVWNGLLFAFGGNAVPRSLDEVAAYDHAANTWNWKTAMPLSLGFARAETVADKIYVFGDDETLEYTPSNDAK